MGLRVGSFKPSQCRGSRYPSCRIDPRDNPGRKISKKFKIKGVLREISLFLYQRYPWSSARHLLIKNANFPVARNILSLCTIFLLFFLPYIKF